MQYLPLPRPIFLFISARWLREYGRLPTRHVRILNLQDHGTNAHKVVHSVAYRTLSIRRPRMLEVILTELRIIPIYWRNPIVASAGLLQ